MSLRLIADGIDYTDAATGLQWSSVDPGGCEMCSFTLPAIYNLPPPDSTVLITEGMDAIWLGYVEEPEQGIDREAAPGHVAAVGCGVLAKDNDVGMVFIDRDLNNWHGMSRDRIVSLGAAFDPKSDVEVTPDTSTGEPALRLQTRTPFNGASGAIVEAWYDAGDGNKVKQLQIESTELLNLAAGGATWSFASILCDADDATGATTLMTDQDANSVAFRRDTAGTAQRWVLLQMRYTSTSAGGQDFYRMVKNVAVIGDHGITLQQIAAGLDGFFPEDIARWVVQNHVTEARIGRIDASDYVLVHSVYNPRVAPEQIISDMCGLLGWHWGFWAPSQWDGTDPSPEFWFSRPPEQATAVVNADECDDLAITIRRSGLYNKARVTYQDGSGNLQSVLVTVANPYISRDRTMPLQLQQSTLDAATAYAQTVLLINQANARGAGPCKLPATVATESGEKLSHTLRPGIDRLKVIGLPSARESWTDDDTRRLDTFRIQRTTCTVDSTGRITTVAELDNGADLLEVLNARAAANAFGGVGAGQWAPNKPAFVVTGPR